jgi:hypothetical protein
MAPIILIVVVLGILVTEYLAFTRVWRPHVRSVVRWSFITSAVLAVISSYITTFHYEHMPNSNTRFVGWPIPRVVFQRDTPDGPWLDFVGITMLLAFPMNFILFVLVPSILALPFTRAPKTSP